jgi:acetyl-CoA carboxylase biotin carboxyl carrier protein
MIMNLKEIKEVIQLMNENGLSEIEIEKDGLKVRLRKGAGGMIESSVVEHSYAPAPAQRPPAPAAPAAPAAPKGVQIKSPMVGTYYSSPAPDAAPFVQPGSQVEIGQVICIIEAMKLMNEIKAEVRGKIAEILVHNGDPVEFGQPLFVIE